MSESLGPAFGAPARVRRRKHHTKVIVALLTALVMLVGLGGVAGATGGKPKPPAPPTPIVDGLAGPLSIDATWNGDVLVGQAFSGTISSVSKRGKVTDLVTEPGAEAVADGPFGSVIYAVSEPPASKLMVRLAWGATFELADVGAYEAANNPDARNTYGIATPVSPECAAQWPTAEFGPISYPGQVDSHAYGLTVGNGGVYVADAGANAIFFVSWTGRISTVAVLPPQGVVIPPDPSVLGLPACVAGLTYGFEPVPTDIELDGRSAFVSLLPGGPEDDSLGARGSVVKVNLRNGTSQPVATGLAGATNVALSPSGDLYVTELFAGEITKINRRGGTSVVATLPSPAAIDWANGRLYVAYDVFASGKIATIKG